MPRKTNRFQLDVMGKQITVQEKYYLNNQDLPTSGSQYQWTDEMLKAIKTCTDDIKYFAQNFFTIITPKGRIHIPLRAYQTDILNTMGKKNRVMLITARQSGKCFQKNSKLKIKIFGIPMTLKAKTLWRILKMKKILKNFIKI